MKKYRYLETRMGKAVFGVFLFALLLLARDTLITSSILGFNRSQFLMLGLICLFGLSFLIVNRREWKGIVTDKRMTAFGVSAVVLLLPMLVKRDWQMMYFSILVCLLFAVFVTYFASYREVAQYYVVILTALGVYSLIATYILRRLAWAGILNPPVFYNSAKWDFYNFGLCFSVPWEAWHRNFGIFREPGVYQFFLLLALYLNNYAFVWKKNWRLWLVNLLLTATMVSTFAIGGFVEMGLFAVFLYFDKCYYREKPGRILGLAVAGAVLGTVIYIVVRIRTTVFEYSVFYEFYDMFLRLTTGSDSLVDRLSAIFTDVGFFLENPLFGDRLANVLHGTSHNTSSTLILYAVLGILGGTLNVVSWGALIWKRERTIAGNLVLLVILFMSFNTQNLVADIFFWLFPYMALVERGLPLIFDRKKGDYPNGTGITEKGAVDPARDRQGDQAGL